MTNEEAIQILNLYDLGNMFLDIDGNPIGYEKMSSACDMAVEALNALKQKPCDDCISRQAVEEMIKAEMPERGMWEIEGDKEKETVCEVCVDLTQKLSELPPVTPQLTKWIPVSERLPKDSQYVLMTVRRMNDRDNHIPFITTGYISWNQLAWWCAHDGDCKSNNIEVLAWKPLPEPYKAESEE